MGDNALQMIFQATVITKNFTLRFQCVVGLLTSDDRQRIEGFPRRCSRAGLRSPDQPLASDLVAGADDKLY